MPTQTNLPGKTVYIPDFFVSVIKCHDTGNLQKEELIWICGSRGRRLHHGREAQQHTAGMIAGVGSGELTFSIVSLKQRK